LPLPPPARPVTKANIQKRLELSHAIAVHLGSGQMLLVPHPPILANGAALASFREMSALRPQTRVWRVPLEKPKHGHYNWLFAREET